MVKKREQQNRDKKFAHGILKQQVFGSNKVARRSLVGISRTFVDANVDNSSCPIPRWDQLPYSSSGLSGSDGNIELATVKEAMWVLFVNCSKVISSRNIRYWYSYHPVTCRSTKDSFVYAVFLNAKLGQLSDTVESVAPSCAYLGIIPASGCSPGYILSSDDDVVDVRAIARVGFAVRFPFTARQWKLSKIISTCLADSTRHFKAQFNGASIWGKASSVIWSEMYFLRCLYATSGRPELYWPILGLLSAIEIVKYTIVLAILLSTQNEYSKLFADIKAINVPCMFLLT
ncbi:hypothetical protein ZWY2020_017189 [Hordeum vulgare]|nr:hypothetical protein ZWY2020_017189 [Hordeum vulgare]